MWDSQAKWTVFITILVWVNLFHSFSYILTIPYLGTWGLACPNVHLIFIILISPQHSYYWKHFGSNVSVGI